MAGPIQSALSNLVSIASGAVVAGKKFNVDEEQARKKEMQEAEKEADYQRAIKTEAEETALEADLVRFGGDPDTAHAYTVARRLGLDTKKFGMIKNKGKFFGTYSNVGEKLSKGALVDSLSSRVINEKGFANRIVELGGSRKSRVTVLVEAMKK